MQYFWRAWITQQVVDLLDHIFRNIKDCKFLLEHYFPPLCTTLMQTTTVEVMKVRPSSSFSCTFSSCWYTGWMRNVQVADSCRPICHPHLVIVFSLYMSCCCSCSHSPFASGLWKTKRHFNGFCSLCSVCWHTKTNRQCSTLGTSLFSFSRRCALSLSSVS